MSWNTTSPDGSQSVKANKSIIQDNFTYTESKLTLDHYFNDDANLDGRHRYANMPKQASEPSIATDCDGIYYLFDNVSTQPFYKNGDSVMQLLGIRAMGVINAAGTLAYSYNVASVTLSGTARYTATFTTALPNNNYLVLGGAIRDNSSVSSELLFNMQAATSLATVKSTTSFKFRTASDGGTEHAPLQAWFVCFGG